MQKVKLIIYQKKKEKQEIYDINCQTKNRNLSSNEFHEILNILHNYCNFNNQDILKYDLNNIVNSIFKKLPDNPIPNNILKFKIDRCGLDKFSQEQKMTQNFSVEISYQII